MLLQTLPFAITPDFMTQIASTVSCAKCVLKFVTTSVNMEKALSASALLWGSVITALTNTFQSGYLGEPCSSRNLIATFQNSSNSTSLSTFDNNSLVMASYYVL